MNFSGQQGSAMKHHILFIFSKCFCILFATHALAIKKQDISPPTFTLLDKICVEVEGEPPILLSDIEKREQQKNMSFLDASSELTRERLLWFKAKKELKYDLSQINKSADEHIRKVMDSLKITKEKFTELLMNPPYLSTFNQFKYETATAILENHIKSTLASQIVITDEQIKSELVKRNTELSDSFDVVFIHILPRAGYDLAAQFKIANDIKAQIKAHVSFDRIKKRYEKQKNVSIERPFAYVKGNLASEYEKQLTSSGNSPATEPFEDKKSVTMIWKIKKAQKILDETDIEKVRKELYDKAVTEKYHTVTDPVMNSSIVVVKDCSKR
jgi:hypothetical protein